MALLVEQSQSLLDEALHQFRWEAMRTATLIVVRIRASGGQESVDKKRRAILCIELATSRVSKKQIGVDPLEEIVVPGEPY